ncbi:MAG: M28 family peptidase [Planctomycetaceae bacterium]|nr:M28 family peptidase [Planctomycetaceae bacterium]
MQQRRRRDRSAPFRWTHLLAVLAAAPLWTSTWPAAWAQAPAAPPEPAIEGPTDGPSADEVAARAILVRSLDAHIAVLTSPFFEGRTPGTDGSRRAKEYAEFFLRQSGLEPAFSGSFRQDFDIAGPTRVARQSLRVGEVELVGAREFTGLGLGRSGAVTGELVFAGYAIQEGPEEYRGFPEELDLTGKVAMVLRFEPRNARGMSRWTENGEWSRRAALLSKVRACVQRGAAAVLVVNPPGAADARARRLMDPGDGGRGGSQVPVLHLTADAGKRLLEALGHDFVALAARADEAGVVEPLGAVAEVDLELERTRVPTQNLGALLPGTGALADQVVVLGAHLDHVGNGSFGSPQDGGTLHPGADDNASGSASLLALVAEISARSAHFDPAVPRRSVLFLLFDAEESGLLGSKHYVGAPVRPIETHSLMINLDMVGRIQGDRVSLQGARSAEGLDVWLEPWLASSGLAIEHSRSVSARSDHASFLDAKVSSLFFTNADGHPDYHRPTDTAEKIATESMADLVALVADVAEAAAFRGEAFVHVPTETASQAR